MFTSIAFPLVKYRVTIDLSSIKFLRTHERFALGISSCAVLSFLFTEQFARIKILFTLDCGWREAFLITFVIINIRYRREFFTTGLKIVYAFYGATTAG